MSTITYNNPVLTIIFDPQEATTVQQILAIHPIAFKETIDNWFINRAEELSRKDKQAILSYLNTVDSITVKQVLDLLITQSKTRVPLDTTGAGK